MIKGESVAAQHWLLLVDITVERKKRRRRKREKKISWGKVKNAEGDKLMDRIPERLDEIYNDEGLQWLETYPMVMEAAKEILGESTVGKYLEKESWWWNEEVQVAVKEKKEA